MVVIYNRLMGLQIDIEKVSATNGYLNWQDPITDHEEVIFTSGISFICHSLERGNPVCFLIFLYQKKQLKQGLQKLSKKIRKKISIFQINIVYYYK